MPVPPKKVSPIVAQHCRGLWTPCCCASRTGSRITACRASSRRIAHGITAIGTSRAEMPYRLLHPRRPATMQPLPVRLLATGLIGLFPALGAAPAAAGGVGFVDMERVFAQSPQGQAVQQRLNEEFGDEQQAFARREQEIRQMQARLERDKPLMSKAQLEKKETEIKTLIEAFEEDFAAVQEQVAKIQQEEGQKLMEPAQDAIAAVAEERDISAVFEVGTFDPNRAGMLYFEEGAEVDLTQAVIDALNAD
ncbi:hypothetical protein CKO31_14975 [Thiohalocapsa halophila]|uniref:OmpH family outer membrane protein n=2 Tax=Thiohalocapsa halophila TaxID=69359 RepID=A0ABS1CJA7_9GAMM|nr:hypothetical protein [Thiohalocapsa halophila]